MPPIARIVIPGCPHPVTQRGNNRQDVLFVDDDRDEEHFWTAMVCVERNPVRARMVRRPWLYRWSSAAAHCGGADPGGLVALDAWRARLAPGLDWRQSLVAALDGKTSDRLRVWTHRGRLLGSDKFVAKLELALGRRLRPLPVGRPRKKGK